MGSCIHQLILYTFHFSDLKSSPSCECDSRWRGLGPGRDLVVVQVVVGVVVRAVVEGE